MRRRPTVAEIIRACEPGAPSWGEDDGPDPTATLDGVDPFEGVAPLEAAGPFEEVGER